MRNIITHEYFGVDVENAWRVIQKDLPMLGKHSGRFTMTSPIGSDQILLDALVGDELRSICMGLNA
jgi:Ribonuclease HepT-like